MADFAAVIRRAVDGLSDNTPEMRVKVYEKARGAVQRQLESMKPRPPEEMLRRQLDKLELAIRDVESEHAEALPAGDEDQPVDAAEDWQQPEQDAAEDERQAYDDAVTADAEPEAEPTGQDHAAAAVAEEEQPEEVAAAEQAWAAPPEDEREPWDPPVEVAKTDSEPATPVHAEPEPWETPVETHAEPEPEPWETPAEPEERPALPIETAGEPEQPTSGVEELVLDAAVIRQAIDAQPVNSAEIRARIYDNARASVRNYLGNLMPRPSDESIARQFDKLDQVIEVVEQEYLAAAQPAVTDVSEPWDPPADHSDVPPDERSSQGLVPDERHIGMWQETPPDEQPQVSTENAAEAWQSPEPGRTEESSPFAEPWEDEPEPLPTVPATAAQTDWAEPLPSAREQDDTRLSASQDDVDPVQPFDDPAAVEHETPAQVPASETAGTADDWAFPEAETSSQTAAQVAGSAGAAAYAAGTPSDERLSEPKMPPALDLLDWDETSFGEEGRPDAQAGGAQRAADNKAIDPFDDGDAFSGEVGPLTPAVATAANKSQDSWNDLDDLIGDNKHSGRGGDHQASAAVSNGVASPRPGKSFRVEPKRRFNFTVLGLALLLVVALGGGGYAAWLYQDRLKDMVANLVDSGPQIPGLETKPEEKASTETKPETTANTPTTEQATGNDTKPATTPTATDTSRDLAALDTSNVPAANKFTQRLLVNGSEVDEGPGGEAILTEGKSVAEQNVAANEAGNTPTTDTSGAATTGNQTPADTQTTVPAETGQVDGATQTPAAENTTQGTQQTAAVAGAQKMFLYEERIGQSVPTAIQGTVVWSLQQEAGEDGKLEPTVQGQINVPDRGLSALMTFKRNSDPSLPASHLVEIVFSLPQDFEGGAIDSVQRIAMKQTEQDRGNALIAVPAKITDDFHMIALNDFPEARASNLELLRTRGWIDMPITYRNGRRALLTLEKGEPGMDAFNKAVQAWLTLANAPASGQ